MGSGSKRIKQRKVGKKINRYILEREKKLQTQYEDSRIRDAKYNKRYKLLNRKGRGCKYLRKDIEIKYRRDKSSHEGKMR